jgi:Lrp/AsnC family leucine-responsive transcriptional regulator
MVQKLIEDTPEFCECDKVTGEDCYIARLFVRSIAELDQVIDRIADKAETNTAIVKAQPIKRRPPPFAAA